MPILESLSTSQDEREIQMQVDELLAIGLDSPAAPLLEKILALALNETIGWAPDVETKGSRGEEGPQDLSYEVSTGSSTATAEEVNAAASDLLRSVSPPRQAAEPATPNRYLNAFFTAVDGPEMIPVDQPLVHNQGYHLVVEINSERRGPGAEGPAFPSGVLEPVWQERESLPLTVWVASRDFTIGLPQVRTLHLPRSGPSESVRYFLQPLIKEGRGRITVEIYYQGHLLQSKQLDVLVIPAAGASPQPGLRTFQVAHVTYTTLENLDPEDIVQFPERLLTIDVALDPRDNSYDFRILDRTQGDEQIAYYDTVLQDSAIQEAVGRVRQQLKHMVTGVQGLEGYEWRLEGDPGLLGAWLARLALVGRQLYRAMLAEETGGAAERLEQALQPGAVIQVNPITGKTTLPWGLFYAKDIKYIPSRTRLCDRYQDHGLHQPCPYQQDPYVVCPFAFWGFRYAIEQLPCWISGETPRLPTLVYRIANGRPLLLNLNVWRDFPLWQGHRQRLQQAGEVELVVAEEVAGLEDIWARLNPKLDVIYFYCHGGADDLLGPYLKLSDEAINSDFLKASRIQWSHYPLVFLNGCATGDYGPESYLSLIDDFRAGGACGVVGTECPVPELFAEAFAARLFPRLFRGERLGQALLETRRQFLLEKHNPLGLLYALFAAHDVSLSHPVAE